MLLIKNSDVHCGPMFDAEIFHTAVDEINKLSPEVVIVTGDRMEEGIKSEFQRAKE